MTNKKLEEYAKTIVKVTYHLKKACHSKEVLFCKDLEITPSEFSFLRHIKEYKEVNAKHLATMMDSTAPRVSKLLNDLTTKGYIVIKKDKKDKRYSLVSLSSKGNTFIDGIMDNYIEFHKNIIRSVENKEDLAKMIDNLSAFESTLSGFCLAQ